MVPVMDYWRWMLPNFAGRVRPSSWRMTEADAQARYPGCQRVEGSLEVRHDERGYDPSHSFHSGLVLRESDGAMLLPATLTSPCPTPLTTPSRH